MRVIPLFQHWWFSSSKPKSLALSRARWRRLHSARHEATATTPLFTPARLRTTAGSGMNELLLTLVALGLLGYVVWLAFGSDDDNGGGGLMAPVLVPVRVRNYR